MINNRMSKVTVLLSMIVLIVDFVLCCGWKSEGYICDDDESEAAYVYKVTETFG